MATSHPRKTWEQQRAAHAWGVVQSIQQDNKRAKEFGVQAKKLPVRILTSGLGPSLAFLKAKKCAPELADALNDWIQTCAWAKSVTETSGKDTDLVKKIIHGDAEFLRLATDECMAYLPWLIRFAEAADLVDPAGLADTE
jgi:CRISPR-associated protein Cmr5